MSCDHMIGTCDSACKFADPPLNIHEEVGWGTKYRYLKKVEMNVAIPPKRSPFDIPFALCREEQRARRNPKSKDAMKVDVQQATDGNIKVKMVSKKPPPSLLDRNVMSQKKYMEFLSVPKTKYVDPLYREPQKRCELEPCPPRLIQLAIPKKRRVFNNWKEYQFSLPVEMLLRFEQILHTETNLDPRGARYYYKKLDKEKRKRRRAKKRLAKKKKLEKMKGDRLWLDQMVGKTADDLVEYVKEQPLFSLNYKQLLLSDAILERLAETKIMARKPSRRCRQCYKRTVIEIADKCAVWIDTLTKFVDVQAIESDEDIAPISISTLAEEGEGESESESELSSEEELAEEYDKWEGEDEFGEGYEDFQKVMKIMDEMYMQGAGEGESLMGLGDKIDMDLLVKLIGILEGSPEDYMSSEVDPDNMAGLKYEYILNKIKDIRDGVEMPKGEPVLEEIITNWARTNEPDQIDEQMLATIHQVAIRLGDLHKIKEAEDAAAKELGAEGEEDAEGKEGGEGEAIGEGTEGEGQETTEGTDAEAGDGTEGAEGAEGAEDAEGAEGEGAEGEGAEGEGGVEGADGGIGAEGGDVLGGEEGVFSDEDLFGISEKEETGDELDKGLTDDELRGLRLEGEDGFGLEDLGWEAGAGEEAVGEDLTEKELEGLEGRIIKGHKPSVVFEHDPNTVCCLSLKIWAVWLLEVTNNAQNWTNWISGVIKKIREFAAIVRGEVKLPNGQKRTLTKAEWRQFAEETEKSVVAWRQYSAHVKELSDSIISNFSGKKVNCCPKCLQDHLIKDVVAAHETLQALTEAINCAGYWQRILDALVEKTTDLAKMDKEDEDLLSISSDDDDDDETLDLEEERLPDSSESSEYEIEEIE